MTQRMKNSNLTTKFRLKPIQNMTSYMLRQNKTTKRFGADVGRKKMIGTERKRDLPIGVTERIKT